MKQTGPAKMDFFCFLPHFGHIRCRSYRNNSFGNSRNLSTSFQQLVFGGEKVKVKYNNFDEELMPHQQQHQEQQQYVKNDQNYQP